MRKGSQNPVVIVRYLDIAALYGKRKVMNASLNSDLFSQYTNDKGTEIVLQAAREFGLCICIVYSPESCLYVEPDGTLTYSDEPPAY